MSSDFNPWRFAQPLELRNMVSAASHRWEKAMREGQTDLAAKITTELEPIARAIEEKESSRR